MFNSWPLFLTLDCHSLSRDAKFQRAAITIISRLSGFCAWEQKDGLKLRRFDGTFELQFPVPC